MTMLLHVQKISRLSARFKRPYVAGNLCQHGRHISSATKTLLASHNKDHTSQHQLNEINIQMLSTALHKQVFGCAPPDSTLSVEAMKTVCQHLEDHNLWGKNTSQAEDVNFKLPKLMGKNVEEHFHKLGESQAEPYVVGATAIVNVEAPPVPKEWVFKRGWTKYDPVSGEAQAVDYPDERVLVFDIEVLMTQADGHFPTLAAAVSPTAW